ncbi:hypothetical protein ACFQH9_06535 [Pseudonocardia lutea]|uniref:Uncharacterized protein n=1 Tax=Pseudonocardia lutea TaxID=2172015 RepID=A0ABW1I6C4_9PSEU
MRHEFAEWPEGPDIERYPAGLRDTGPGWDVPDPVQELGRLAVDSELQAPAVHDGAQADEGVRRTLGGLALDHADDGAAPPAATDFREPPEIDPRQAELRALDLDGADIRPTVESGATQSSEITCANGRQAIYKPSAGEFRSEQLFGEPVRTDVPSGTYGERAPRCTRWTGSSDSGSSRRPS